MPQLARFTLSDMVRTSAALRRLGREAASLESFAQRVVGLLYDTLVEPGTGARETALVRFYKTHAWGDLSSDLQAFARALSDVELQPWQKCLVLLATIGEEAAWRDRRASRAHRAVPLPSAQMVTRFPMIAQLITQFGLPLNTVVEPDPALLVELNEKTYNVFYVPQAAGSPHIPDQDFVARYGIASALGFGGMLPSGDLFAVVLFSRVPIPAPTAELFKTLALSVKVALLPLSESSLFDADDGRLLVEADADYGDHPARVRQRALEQLLEVHEVIATDQALKLEAAWEAERLRGCQLRSMADAAIRINASRSLDEILAEVTQQARATVGTHQAVASLSVSSDWAQAINAVSLSDKYARYHDYEGQPDGSGIYALVCETNTPMRMTQEELERHPRWRSFGGEGERHPPMRGWLAAPFVSRDGANLGLIQVSDKHEGEFSEEDEAILVQLAQMASIALENVRLYQHEHEVAAELQRALLPQELPTMPGVDVAARYYAGGAGVPIGGDWYDVFPIAKTSLAVVVGDVAGRSTPAASVMGQLRMAVRAYALEESSPAAVVSRVDRFLQRLGLIEFATLAYGVWTPTEEALEIVLAGHPAPLVLAQHGEPTFIDVEPCVPLGAMPDAAFAATRVTVADASTLLLYSDGLVEARDLPIADGLQRLLRLAAEAPPDLGGFCEHIAAEALSADADDDVTLLAVRAEPRRHLGG